MKNIDVDELKERFDAGEALVLLDVREPEEWEIARIDRAVHIPMNEIPERLNELPRDQPIICLCHHGWRSAQVAYYLLEQGFTDVANLDGGINAWSQLIDPGVPTY